MSTHGDDDLKGWRVSHKISVSNVVVADLGDLDFGDVCHTNTHTHTRTHAHTHNLR